ncbi:MAG: protein translocase, partial [Mycoplasmataceae bacterium]|nr:protein translocase [Mycoplasmataceae bacterium]
MKRFKNNKIRRLVILGVTLVAAILTVALGSSLYVGKNGRKSIEYGGGAEYVVGIKSSDSHKISKSEADGISEEIASRVDSLGISGATATAETGDIYKVRVRYPGVTTKEKKEAIGEIITKKPHLTFTDVYGNPLFNRNKRFNRQLHGDPKKNIINPRTESNSPIKGGAHAVSSSSKGYEVQINVIPFLRSEWFAATRYLAGLPKGKQEIVAWLNIKDYIKKYLANGYNTQYQKNPLVNPVGAAYYKGRNLFKTPKLNLANHLISRATVSRALSGKSFVITGGFDIKKAKQLARKINYGATNYRLDLQYSNYITATYGSNAFNKAMIAGLIVFVVIAIFLVANYGLLGALSTISISLYIMITLAMFTLMRGQYSPESIAALIIGVGMAVDANIITFERLKREVYNGASLQKGFKDSNRKSLSTIFDANITTMIVAVVLFFFGTRNIIGLSVTLILSIILTLIVMLGFTRFTTTLLVKTGIFNNKRHLLGIKPIFDVKVQNIIEKPNYIKSAKYFMIISSTIFAAAFILLIVMTIKSGAYTDAFNLSREFTGGTIIEITNPGKNPIIDPAHIQGLKNDLQQHGAIIGNIEEIRGTGGITALKYATRDVISPINGVIGINNIYNASTSLTSTSVASELVRNALITIGIAIGGVILYTLLRFKWTYSIAAIIALLHDGLIVLAIFMLTRVEISPIFVAGLIAIMGYSINDTIVTFDRVRERMSKFEGEMTKENIRMIANKSIKDTLKRSILTSLTTISAVLILMAFGNATKLS